jgi:hypothetical protein
VWSEAEEEFFRAGAHLEAANAETWDDLDEPRQPSFWQRAFSRRPMRPATEPPRVIANANDDDDWEWEIAIARARHAG